MLNHAWEMVLNLVVQFQEWRLYWLQHGEYPGQDKLESLAFDEKTCETDGNLDEYLYKANDSFLIAAALLQQGVELLLKAKIAEVSPYLLIAGGPEKWPKGCDKNHTRFSSFRTPDADELIRICDTVCKSRFPETFRQNFSEMRRLRNKVFHTVDSSLSLSVKSILTTVLAISDEFFKPHNWYRKRYEYLSKGPISVFGKCDALILREFNVVNSLLTKPEMEEYFGLGADSRRYLCPSCLDTCNENMIDVVPAWAILEPNSPDSTNVFCVLCKETFLVFRESCVQDNCPGNVIEGSVNSDLRCLTCGQYSALA